MPEDKAAANKREAEYSEGQKVWPRAYHTVHPATPRHTPPHHATPRHATPRHATPRLRTHSSHQPVPAALG